MVLIKIRNPKRQDTTDMVSDLLGGSGFISRLHRPQHQRCPSLSVRLSQWYTEGHLSHRPLWCSQPWAFSGTNGVTWVTCVRARIARLLWSWIFWSNLFYNVWWHCTYCNYHIIMIDLCCKYTSGHWVRKLTGTINLLRPWGFRLRFWHTLA